MLAERLDTLAKSGIGLMATLPEGHQAEPALKVCGAERKILIRGEPGHHATRLARIALSISAGFAST